MKHEKPVAPETLEGVIALGRLSLAFGRVDRRTCQEDGCTPESDTDHTVMLGLIATAYADRFAPHLDKGKIAQYALVHDLVEVYAGDTPTLHIQTSDAVASKQERERVALDRLRAEFDSVFPWITRTIEEYEELHTPEARFVKFIDKILPKVTHVLNSGAVLKEEDFGLDRMTEKLEYQYASIVETYGSDQPEASQLFAAFAQKVYSAVFGKQ